LSEVKPLLERDIDPLSWSWSSETNKQPELYNTGNPIDLRPIVKEDIPTNRIIPTGYFMLKKSKTLNKFQIGIEELSPKLVFYHRVSVQKAPTKTK
jgi:hypothetical protein